MMKHYRLSFKLSVFITSMILIVEAILLLFSYEIKCDQLIEMKNYELSLYGKNLIYTQRYIDQYLREYAQNITLLSLLISIVISVGFFIIYNRYVGRYLTKISKLNNEMSPLLTKNSFERIPNDEIGDLISSRIKMLSRIDKETSNYKKLLRILSHDLANLLMINIGSISVLKKILNKSSNEKINKYLNKIEFSNNKQKELIESVRYFDANKEKLAIAKIESHDLFDLVSESITVFEDRLKDKDLIVNWKGINPKMFYVMVNRILFVNNVLNNLLSNAIKFSENHSEIFVNAHVDKNQYVILEVKDSGIGMPREMLENLFQGGVQISRKGVNGENGTGFGMGLLKSTLDSLNCDIEVESKERDASHSRSGTKFIIKFKNHNIKERSLLNEKNIT